MTSDPAHAPLPPDPAVASAPSDPAAASPHGHRHDPPSRWAPSVVLPRLPGLLAGLLLFGIGIAFMAEADMGLGPWEVFHQGIARQTGLALGTVSILVGIPILAAWFPLGERPGIGTVLNILLIGTSTNVAMGIIPPVTGQPQQLLLMLAGVVTIATGSGLYLASDLGPGPRDGLMTGLHFRFGWSIRRARTAVELTVLLLGFLAGGTVGVGTIVFALAIGPLVQVALRVFDREGRVSRRRRAMLEARGVVGE